MPRATRGRRRSRSIADGPFRQLFDRAPQPMLVFDMETLRFLAVNDAAVAAYGYPRREFLRMTILDIRPPEDVPQVLRVLDVARTATDVHGTWRHVKRSGEVMHVEVHWNSVRFRGRAARLALALDVSPRQRAQRELKRLHEELEQRVAERTAELEAANRELEAQMHERERLASRLMHVQERERRQLARELHDEVGQILTGLKLTLQAVPRVDGARLAEQIAWAESLVDGLMKQIREMSLDLRPSVLDDLGLLPALLWHIERYLAATGVAVAFTHVGIEGRLPFEVETAAFRIVQEALTNVARHAGVSQARLFVRRDATELSVIVEDEGCGIRGAILTDRTGGVSGMRERARLLGGDLFVETGPDIGTRITAVLPLAQSPAEAGAP